MKRPVDWDLFWVMVVCLVIPLGFCAQHFLAFIFAFALIASVMWAGVHVVGPKEK